MYTQVFLVLLEISIVFSQEMTTLEPLEITTLEPDYNTTLEPPADGRKYVKRLEINFINRCNRMNMNFTKPIFIIYHFLSRIYTLPLFNVLNFNFFL